MEFAGGVAAGRGDDAELLADFAGAALGAGGRGAVALEQLKSLVAGLACKGKEWHRIAYAFCIGYGYYNTNGGRNG